MAITVSRVRALHTGHYTMPADDTRFPNARIIVRAFLIEHPRGLFLFDTGFSPDHREALEAYAVVRILPIREALRTAGVAPSDIKMIANCHLHSDHSGGNRHFARTPIFVQASELRHARATPGYTHLLSVADFAGARLEEIDGEAQLLPGLRIVPTPGHSPGHQSLAVDTRRGRVVLGGQAVNFASDFAMHRYSRELDVRGESHPEYPAWIRRIEELDPWRVYFAHDSAVWQRDAFDPIGG